MWTEISFWKRSFSKTLTSHGWHNFSNIHNVITAALFYSVLSTWFVLLELNIALYHMSRIVQFRIRHFHYSILSTGPKRSRFWARCGRSSSASSSMLYSRLLNLIKVTALRYRSMKSNLILSTTLVFFFRPFCGILFRLVIDESFDYTLCFYKNNFIRTTRLEFVQKLRTT